MWELVVSQRNTFLHAEWTMQEELAELPLQCRRAYSCPPEMFERADWATQRVIARAPFSAPGPVGRGLNAPAPATSHEAHVPEMQSNSSGSDRRASQRLSHALQEAGSPEFDEADERQPVADGAPAWAPLGGGHHDSRHSGAGRFFSEALEATTVQHKPSASYVSLSTSADSWCASCVAPPPARGKAAAFVSEDSRTGSRGSSSARPGLITLALRSLPCRCSDDDVLELIQASGFAGHFACMHLPLKVGSHENQGHALFAFFDAEAAAEFFDAMTGARFPERRSSKALVVEVVQEQALMEHALAWPSKSSQWGPVVSHPSGGGVPAAPREEPSGRSAPAQRRCPAGETQSSSGDDAYASEQDSFGSKGSTHDSFQPWEMISERPPYEEPRDEEGQARSSAAQGSQEGVAGSEQQEGDAVAERPPLLTLVMKDIPVRCKEEDFLASIRDSGFTGRWEFVYLPMKFGLRKNRGYAFAAFSDAESAAAFYHAMSGTAVGGRKSEKAMSVEVAKGCISAEHMRILGRKASQWGTVLSETR